MKYIDSWKNSKVFKYQLALNKRQLSSGEKYPSHWHHFIDCINDLQNVTRIVDVGCGAGAYYGLSQRHFPDKDYVGYDYSENAVSIARDAWGGNFEPRGYEDLSKNDIKTGDVVVANALCDVLPNGQECFDHLLSLKADNLIIQRMKITGWPSFYKTLDAYNITTYSFYHKEQDVIDSIQKHGYEYKVSKMDELNFNFLLKRMS
jgi:trans-aconitate methyltransferase